MPITVAGEWRTLIEVVAVLSYLISGLPLIWIALQELGLVNKHLEQEAQLKVHAICVALFLVFGHVAMIAGMRDPGLLGYAGTVQHEHKAPDSTHPH
jgi:formate hydrogenlyase subunit 3/multisubunit Na+/H+ antiporter MnhD subunit